MVRNRFLLPLRDKFERLQDFRCAVGTSRNDGNFKMFRLGGKWSRLLVFATQSVSHVDASIIYWTTVIRVRVPGAGKPLVSNNNTISHMRISGSRGFLQKSATIMNDFVAG
jgi:hypothetical protein